MHAPRWTPLLVLSCCLASHARGEESDPSHYSPDGRFLFVAFSSEEVDSGKRPAFGIVETATGDLVSDPGENLGDASRPEETILWAPDSLSYALTSRVGTRHLDTFLYRWDGKAFVRARWEGAGRIEALADLKMEKDKARLGVPSDTGLGQCLRGDDLAERWLDPERLILGCVEEYHVAHGDRGGVVRGDARALVRWDEASEAYVIERELHAPDPWPLRVEDAGSFEVVQADRGGEEANARIITVTQRERGQSKRLEAENWLTAPVIIEHGNDWPQLELVSHGPDEFQMRRLYRVVDGAYRCVRIAELTRRSDQAPEDAPLFEIEPGLSAFLLRDHPVPPGGTDVYESFQTERPSPDGKWKAVFTYHPQYLQRAEIAAADGSGEAEILYDFDSGEGGVETIASVLWSPDSSAFALYLQDGPRAGHTLLHRRVEGVWSQTAMPEVNYEFLGKGGSPAAWGVRLEQPLWWNGGRELVLELSGHFRGDDGFDYRALAILTWNEAGEPAAFVAKPQKAP